MDGETKDSSSSSGPPLKGDGGVAGGAAAAGGAVGVSGGAGVSGGGGGDVMDSMPDRPLGLPVNCVVRVSPVASGSADDSGGGAEAVLEGSRVKLGPSNDDIFSVNSVYGRAVSQEELFAKELRRVVKKVVEGYNASVVVLGQSGSGKSYTLEGDANHGFSNGLVGLSMAELFAALQKKMSVLAAQAQSSRSRYDSRQSSFRVRVQHVEIYNDTIHDLIDPTTDETAAITNVDRTVEFGEYGAVMPGVSSRLVHHANEFMSLFVKSTANRTSASTEFGPLRERASVVTVVDVEQRVAPTYERLQSRMMFVNLPATDVLELDPSALRQRQGPRLNREIIGFSNLVRRLSVPEQVDFADYTQSKTSMLLDDVLGGNSITLCVTTLVPSDLHGSRISLEHMRMVSQVMNYPVVGDERSLGVLRRLRLQVFHLREELNNLRLTRNDGMSNQQQKDQAEQQAMIIELKGRLIKSDLERSKVEREKQQLVERYAMFRDKYTQLVKAKADLQAELIKSEEERLSVSKLIIDLQIENADLKEQATTEKYELEAKLLTVENDMVERDLTEQKKRDQFSALNKKIQELIDEKKEISLEYVALRQNFNNLQSDLQAEKNKNEEVGAEFLSLVNAKDSLEQETERLRAEADMLRNKTTDLQIARDDLDKANKELSSRLSQVSGENEQLKLEAIRKDVEMTKLRNEFDSKQTELEKHWIQFTTEKDRELTGLREISDREASKANEQAKQLEEQIRALTAELKLSHREIEQLQSKLGEQASEIQEMDTEVNALRQKMSDVSEKYRAKLLQYMNEVQHITTEVQSKQNMDEHSLEQTLKPEIEKMHQDMMETHTARERELLKESDDLRKRNNQLLRKNRELGGQYRTLRAFAEDVAPKGVLVPVLGEKELKTLLDSGSEGEQRIKVEVQLLRENVQSLRTQLDQQKQLTLAQAENFQKKSAFGQKELFRLRDEVERLEKENEHLRKSSRGDSSEAVQNLQQFLEKKFTDQIQELVSSSQKSAANNEELFFLKDQVQQLRKENERLKERLKSRPDTAKSTTSRSTLRRWEEKEEQYKAQIARLQDKVLEAQRARPRTADDSKNLAEMRKKMKEFQLNTQRQLEKERATWKSRATRAEQELASFQDYMKSEILKYQRELIRLKQELAHWKAVAGSAGAGGGGTGAPQQSGRGAGAHSHRAAWRNNQ